MSRLLISALALGSMAANADALQGEWESASYGYHLSIASDGTPRLFDLIGGKCSIRGEQKVFERFEKRTPNALTARVQNEVYEYRFERVKSDCTARMLDVHSHSLALIRALFNAHYPFWEAHAVDRQAFARARSAATLIKAFRDSHVSYTPSSGPTAGTVMEAHTGRFEAIQARVGKPLNKAYWQHIAIDILQGNGTTTCNRRMQYGRLNAETGYVALIAMGGFATGENADDASAFEACASEMVKFMNNQRVSSLLIDLTINVGGYDFVARRLAGSFANAAVPLYSKSVPRPKADAQTLYAEPALDRFPGRVAVLTSDLTVSAGEVAVLSMRALRFKHFGEPTRGALSDALEKHLPDGSTLTLSNELYVDSEGKAWEGKGIQPDFALINLDSEAPLVSHKRAVLTAAARIR